MDKNNVCGNEFSNVTCIVMTDVKTVIVGCDSRLEISVMLSKWWLWFVVSYYMLHFITLCLVVYVCLN